MKAAKMLQTHPETVGLDRELVALAIDAAVTCSQACTACADACLSEDMVADLRACIRLNLDCADICSATVRILSRHTGDSVDVTRAQLEACIAACRACGNECVQHASMHEHCAVCADACRACEAACRELLATLS